MFARWRNEEEHVVRESEKEIQREKHVIRDAITHSVLPNPFPRKSAESQSDGRVQGSENIVEREEQKKNVKK